MATLLDISDDMKALDDLLFEAGGDITDPEVETAIDDWMDSLDDNFKAKVDNYAALITEIEARSAARKAEAERLRDRAKIDANTAESLKAQLEYVFEQRQIKKIETKRYTIGLRKHGGKLPLDLDDVRPDELSPRFQRVQIDVDRTAIREALEAGEELKFARLGERGQSLSI